jgi:hypothetical protein
MLFLSLLLSCNTWQVEKVKRECLPGNPSGVDCPLLEEYDFAHDTSNPHICCHLLLKCYSVISVGM